MAMIVPHNDLFRDIRTNVVYEDQACTKRVGELRGSVLERDDEQATPPTPPAETVPAPVVAPRALVAKEERFDATMLEALLKAPEDVLNTGDRKALKSYNKAKSSSSTRTVVWKQSEVAGIAYGRLYPEGPSLMTLSRAVRGALAHASYWDVDVANCHYWLALHYMKTHGLKCEEVENYCNNRDACLKAYSDDRSTAKDAYLAVLFGGKTNHPALLRFFKEIEHLTTHVWNAHTWTHLVANKRNGNTRGSALSLFIQTEESKVLRSIDAGLASLGREVGCLIHDGLLVRKKAQEEECPRSLMDALEEYVLQGTGYTIHLEAKPLINTFKPEEWAVQTSDLVSLSDSDAAKVFMERCGEYFINQGDEGIWFWSETNGTWTRCISFCKAVTSCIESARLQDPTFMHFKVSGKAVDVGGSSARTHSMAVKAEAYVKEGTLNLLSSTRHVLFTNGIWNLETNTFQKGFNRDIVFLYSAGIPFREDEDEDAIDTVFQRLGRDPYLHNNAGASGLYAMQAVAAAAAGEHKRQKFYFGISDTSMGKSSWCHAWKKILGGFAGAWSVSSLDMKATHSQDDARRLQFLVKLYGRRVAFASEMSESSQLSGTLLKMMTGGTDTVEARRSGLGERDIPVTATFFAFANSSVEIVPCDNALKKRYRIFEPTTMFVENPTQPHERPIIPGLDDMWDEYRYKIAGWHLLGRLYRDLPAHPQEIPVPPSVRATIQSTLAEQSLEKLMNAQGFYITNNPADTTACRTVAQAMAGHGYSTTRLGREIKKLIALDVKNSSPKRGGGEVYHGIRSDDTGYSCL